MTSTTFKEYLEETTAPKRKLPPLAEREEMYAILEEVYFNIPETNEQLLEQIENGGGEILKEVF
jgi:hypothetical protein